MSPSNFNPACASSSPAFLMMYSAATAATATSPQSCLTLSTLWTVAHQAPLSMGFSRQEYWNGMPLPSPMMYSAYKLNKQGDNIQP